MNSREKQRIVIKFYKANSSVKQTFEMVQKTFGKETLIRANIFQWNVRFCKEKDYENFFLHTKSGIEKCLLELIFLFHKSFCTILNINLFNR